MANFAYAEEPIIDLSNKALDKPTLDYLKENNVLIPQKGVYDPNTKTWADAPAIDAPESAYKITVGTEEDHSFEYKTYNEDGIVTSSYYKIDLKTPLTTIHPEFDSGHHIIWQEVEAPAEGEELPVDTIAVELPNEVTKYYRYTYSQPEGYAVKTETQTQTTTIDDPNITSENSPYILKGGSAYQIETGENITINDTLFKDNSFTSILDVKTVWTGSSGYGFGCLELQGGAIYNAGDITSIKADFVGNIANADALKSANRWSYVNGGAIYNAGTIGNIVANFINNQANATSNNSTSSSRGGAIYNTGTISGIDGVFVNNSAKGQSSCDEGGAIANIDNAKIGDIHASFIGNSVSNHSTSAGGAISNTNNSSIGNIYGDFIGNYVISYTESKGGAIYNNNSSIKDILGNFIGNSTTASKPANGGAIYNINGSIGNIYGNFVKNSTKSLDSSGGAIYNNSGTIGNIIGDFIENNSNGSGDVRGGAIFNGNRGEIGDIQGNFIKNSVESPHYSYGGAIYNDAKSKIGNITGDFINNSVSNPSGYSSYGGAIYNCGVFGNITGDFINNLSDNYGGAIYNSSDAGIGNITGNFIGNSVENALDKSYDYYGGAIYNYSKINNITGNFINNSVKIYSDNGSAWSGAIYNQGIIGNIKGNFIGNIAQSFSEKSSAFGGAIVSYTAGQIGDIEGDFISNQAISPYNASSGAISTGKNTGNIKGNFINNSALGGQRASSGAISTSKNTGNIKGNFINNHAVSNGSSYGGAMSISHNSTRYDSSIGNITANFVGNYVEGSDATGGAVFINRVTGKLNIGEKDSDGNVIGGFINSNFINNYAKANEEGAAKGGALYGNNDLNIIADNGISEFTGNYVQVGDKKDYQAVYMVKNRQQSEQINDIDITTNHTFPALNLFAKNNGKIIINDKIAGDGVVNNFKFSYTSARDEALNQYIYNYNIYDNNNQVTQTVRYYTTSAKDESSNKYVTTFHLLDENNNEIQSYRYTYNYNYTNGVYKYTFAILDEDNNVIDTIETYDSSFVSTGYPNIKAYTDGYKLNIDGDATGQVFINDVVEATDVKGNKAVANLSLSNTNLYLGRDDVFNGNNLTLNSGFMSMINGQVGVSALNSLTLTSNTNFVADVDLLNQEMDRFTANEYSEHTGNLNVVGMNILTDAPADRNLTEIYFAEQGLKDHVTHTLRELPQSQSQNFEVYTPIYKYNVTYDNREDGGYFQFTRGGNEASDPSNPGGVVVPPSNPSDNFNPAVLDSPVASRAGAQSAISETVRFAFQHMDTFSQLPFAERMAIIHNNQYAINDTEATPHYNTDLHQGATKGYWIRPYTSFEKINLHNGPDVDAITYGTLVGLDSNFKPLRNGWYNVQSVYAGYNGSSLSYSGVDTTLNGGVLGLTETFYKNNFFTALTATAGASMATGSTMYGNEDYAMLVGGIGAKGGYNFEFKGGKYILQPIMFANYSFVNTFDYTNAAGVKMTSTPLHTLQLNPQLKFVSNLKNGWQPYASVGVVWNVLNTSKVKANDVILPRMTVDPYVEYGLGLQRNWKDKYTGFAQAMVRNGGRNGVALTFGFRWALGKEAL